MKQEYNYCNRCGSPMEVRDVHGNPRPMCTSCGWVVYLDPKVVVGMLLNLNGGLVMVKRATNPGKGLWSFPAGFVDRGEIAEDAAARETWEETGLESQAKSLAGVYSRTGDPLVLIVYDGEVTGGEMKVGGPEVQEVGAFALDELPPLAFDRDAPIIEAWFNRRG